MKLAISGKGGVGKTTFSAMVSAAVAQAGRNVVAIDADPDANLASAFGSPPQDPLTTLSAMRDLIAERTGSKDNYGGYFKLNPKVDDIPDRFAQRIGPHIRLLTLGGVTKGGGGCICPATALLRALLVHLVIAGQDALVMDMEAGIEHLGRATAQATDALVLVVNESPWSIHTALRVRDLAGDIGLKKLFVVANRVESSTDLAKIAAQLDGIPLVGQIPYDARLTAGVMESPAAGQPNAAMRQHLPRIDEILSNIQSRL